MSSFIPENAPFNEEQRAWLNGFFSGLMGIQAAGTANAQLQAAGLDSTALPMPDATSGEPEDFPWHDDSLPIVDRMEMAEGKPLSRRLMAAMAQLDCGSCGYVCQTYAEAIASGDESNLTLCSPGGKETKQMIKRLLKEEGDAPTEASGGRRIVGEPVTNGSTGAYSRANPFSASLIESRPLNREGSAKDTRHVAIDLESSGLRYEVGDALGVFPVNCGELVSMIIDRIGADPEVPMTAAGATKTLRTALSEDFCLKEPSDELIELVLPYAEAESQSTLKTMLSDGVPDGFDVLDVLELAHCRSLSATELLETLEPLNPRLYSIASSMRHVGEQVHLTVGKVAFEREQRVRKGVASTMLAERVQTGEKVRVFVQPNHGGFTIPKDPSAPMIMIGPGTGIAPFMAFLQERDAQKCNGDNWLFFGDQHEAFDFLYREELEDYVARGVLSRLDTAFSRDGETKVYVQDRMRENAAELWRWIDSGGHVYVCGDATRMAVDVDRTLVNIIHEQGSMSEADAKQYVKTMSQEHRYVRDVY